MNLREYLEYIRDVPFPTEDQFRRFAEHVANAHSWYKHLDLHAGGEFIVFLDPRAGGGFDESQERIHHTWKTSSEYVQKFGHLAYIWRDGGDSGPYDSDYAFNARVALSEDGDGMEFTDIRETPVLELPREILEQCGFILYPFACDNGVIRRRFESEFEAMEKGALSHPCLDLLLRFHRADQTHGHASDTLQTECERRAAAGETVRIPKPGTKGAESWDIFQHWFYLSKLSAEEARDPAHALTAAEQEYVLAEGERARAWEALAENEAAKIRRALDNLKRMLEDAGLSPATPLELYEPLNPEDDAVQKIARLAASLIRAPRTSDANWALDDMAGGFLRVSIKRHADDALTFTLHYGFQSKDIPRLTETLALRGLEKIQADHERFAAALEAELKNVPGIHRAPDAAGDEPGTRAWHCEDDFSLRLERSSHRFKLTFKKKNNHGKSPDHAPAASFLDGFAFFARGRESKASEFRAVLIPFRNFQKATYAFGEKPCRDIVNRKYKLLRRGFPEAAIIRLARDRILVLDGETERAEFIDEIRRYASDIEHFDLHGHEEEIPEEDLFSSSAIVMEGRFDDVADFRDVLNELNRLAEIDGRARPGRRIVTRFKPAKPE